ncbi:hypothetical protein BD560DRAFT_132407 [Blakeslea trispora]|nr:hypothetical protein BD560DRAFT_132407 [Blakeslea trispora]
MAKEIIVIDSDDEDTKPAIQLDKPIPITKTSLPKQPNPKTNKPTSQPIAKDTPFSLPPTKRKREWIEIDDEDGDEEDMLSFVDYVYHQNQHTHQSKPKPTVSRVQCPLCRLFFSQSAIEEHAADCHGQVKEGEGIKKRTIGVAVAQDVQARKRRNQGVTEIGPINYYADSDALAVDGTGFDQEVSGGLSWESAGQIRFG